MEYSNCPSPASRRSRELHGIVRARASVMEWPAGVRRLRVWAVVGLYSPVMTDRSTALRVLAALRRTPIGDGAVLVGSSGLFGFDTKVPALTEDIDVAVDVPTVEREGPVIVDELLRQGFSHEVGTATFVSEDGVTFDLLGHGEPAQGDHIAGTGALRVMVFEDISRVVGVARATMAVAGGGRSLTPAGFVATKLLTERAHKGSKDKIQALLVIAERAEDERFIAELGALLRGVDSFRLEDLRASAQDAFLALTRDPAFADAGAEGYADLRRQVETGLERLVALLEGLHV